MPIKWLYLISLIVVIGISSCLFYPKIENFFVFFPETSFDLTPGNLHLNFKDVYFSTEHGKTLHGWFFPSDEDSPVLLFCHGNAGNISHRLDNVRLLLEKKLQVFIFGRSLGAAVAVDVSLKRDIRSIIIESAFISTKGMAKTMFLFSLFSPILPANYNNLEKIAHIKVPKLFIHGEEDNIVPFSMGQKLFDASKAPKYFFRIKGAGHNDTYPVGGEKYFQTIATFSKESKI